MSDTTRPLDDYSRTTDRYREDLMTLSVDDIAHPLARINQPRVPGVFHVHKKNTIPAISPQMSDRLKLGSDTKKPKVGVEVGYGPNRKEVIEMNQKLQRLGLLTSQAGIGIDTDASGKIVVEIPPEFQSNKEDLTAEHARTEVLRQRIPLITRFARLEERAKILKKSTLAKDKKDTLDDITTSLQWLHTEPFKDDPAKSKDMIVSLATLENNIQEGEESLATENSFKVHQLEETNRKQREIISITRELPDLYVSFEKLQGEIKEILPRISDALARKEIESMTNRLLSLKQDIQSSPTKELVGEFKKTLNDHITLIGEITTEINAAVAKAIVKKAEEAAQLSIQNAVIIPKKLEKDEREKIHSLLVEENEMLATLENKRDSFFEELTSELEKDMLIRRFTQLKNTKKETEKALSAGDHSANALITEYKQENASVDKILSMIQGRLTALYTRALYPSPTSASSLNSPQKKDIVLRTPLQRNKAPFIKEIKSLRDITETREATTIFKLHENLFGITDERHQEYLKLYLHKKWVNGDPNKEASEKVIEKYLTSLDRKKEALTFEIQGYEKEIAAAKDTNRKNILLIEAEGVKKELLILAQEINKLEKISNDTILRHKEEGSKSSSFIKTRQMYSPSSDASTFDVGKRREDLTRKEKGQFDAAVKSRKIEGEETMSDEELDSKRKEVSLATDKIVHSHHTGMISPATGDTSMPNQEKIKIKSQKVNKLHEILMTLRATKYGNKNWQAYAAATVIALSGSGIGYIGARAYDTREKSEKPYQTLKQAISWKDFPEVELFKSFIEDLSGNNKMNFIDFMKKHAPLLNIDQNNPSTIQTIATINCETLLNSPDETVYGLHEDQRRQACAIVSTFETIIRATDEAKRGSSQFTELSKKTLDPSLTVEKLYDLVKKTIATADGLETYKK